MGVLRFACTLEPQPTSSGQVLLFDLVCRLRWPLTKARNAPRVDAMYAAKAVKLVTVGAVIPTCIFRFPSPESAPSQDHVLITANSEESKGAPAAGCVLAVNFESGEVKSFATGLQSAFGIARYQGGFLVSDPKGHRIWRLAMNGSKSSFIGSGKQGACDGPASECDLSVPLGLAVAGSTVFFVQADGRVRLFSLTEQFCNYQRSSREFGETVGILDQRIRKIADERQKLRKTDFVHGLDTLQIIVLDREDWYKETRSALGLPENAKGMKGPEGVPCFSTFDAWQSSIDDLRWVHESLKTAGLTDLAANLRLDKPNTMPVEHLFGHNAIGYSSMATQGSWLPVHNRSIEEAIVSSCDVGFAHCTTTQP